MFGWLSYIGSRKMWFTCTNCANKWEDPKCTRPGTPTVLIAVYAILFCLLSLACLVPAILGFVNVATYEKTHERVQSTVIESGFNLGGGRFATYSFTLSDGRQGTYTHVQHTLDFNSNAPWSGVPPQVGFQETVWVELRTVGNPTGATVVYSNPAPSVGAACLWSFFGILFLIPGVWLIILSFKNSNRELEFQVGLV